MYFPYFYFNKYTVFILENYLLFHTFFAIFANMELLKNKKAYFEYNIEKTFVAGVKLLGTEIKSIRNKDMAFNDSYCFIEGTKIYLKGFYIKKYSFGGAYNHDELRVKELLLTKKELRELRTELQNVGSTIMPLTVFIDDYGKCKFTIGLAKGRKKFEKRQVIKEREAKKQIKQYS